MYDKETDHWKHRMADQVCKISWKTKMLLERWHCGATGYLHGQGLARDRESWRTQAEGYFLQWKDSLDKNRIERGFQSCLAGFEAANQAGEVDCKLQVDALERRKVNTCALLINLLLVSSVSVV